MAEIKLGPDGGAVVPERVSYNESLELSVLLAETFGGQNFNNLKSAVENHDDSAISDLLCRGKVNTIGHFISTISLRSALGDKYDTIRNISEVESKLATMKSAHYDVRLAAHEGKVLSQDESVPRLINACEEFFSAVESIFPEGSRRRWLEAAIARQEKVLADPNAKLRKPREQLEAHLEITRKKLRALDGNTQKDSNEQ
ncbi:MAG TPA: hypothetical protein PK263_06455 [bacterium]|nr:hypothetical protein [bacterium]